MHTTSTPQTTISPDSTSFKKLKDAFRLREWRCTFFHFALIGIVGFSLAKLDAQDVPTTQGSIYNVLYVGEHMDSMLQSAMDPSGGLGAITGSLQTTDAVQHEVDLSLAKVKAPAALVLKPTLTVGWQVSTQSTTVNNYAGTSQSGVVNSAFVAPAMSLLYDRAHGPWDLSLGYSVGLLYYSNPNFVASGSSISGLGNLYQSAFVRSSLQTTRYNFDVNLTGSSGSGYDTSSASNNRQNTASAALGFKYFLSSHSSLLANAGYSLMNYFNSTATPNNDTTSYYASLASLYDFSEKSHLSSTLGFGGTGQLLQQGTAAVGNTALATSQNKSLGYVQFVENLKYDITSKVTADAGIGARYVSTTDISNQNNSYFGFRPSWALGLTYTPTDKTSFVLSSGEQGTDVRPEFNFMAKWKPRKTTTVSLAVAEYESFANSLLNQYQVTQSITGSVTQDILSNVRLQLSGGYAAQQYINLSNQNINGQNTSQLPPHYMFGKAQLLWKINQRMTLNNDFYINTGQVQSVANYRTSSQPVCWYSISLSILL